VSVTKHLGDMILLIFSVIFRPSFYKIQILLSTLKMHYGTPNAYNFWYYDTV
jgi:hypothetical protein